MIDIAMAAAVRFRRSSWITFAVTFCFTCGLLSGGIATAQAQQFNPEVLMPPSRQELPHTQMKVKPHGNHRRGGQEDISGHRSRVGGPVGHIEQPHGDLDDLWELFERI